MDVITHPTTLAEAIAEAGQRAANGVFVVPIGEDAAELIAVGHLDPAVMLAACEHWAPLIYGGTLAEWIADHADESGWPEPEHKYGVLRLPEEPDDECPWYCQWVDADAPGAEPITILDLS